ncbi:MAG: hypothetical protein ACYCOU_06575 [Sulfobacillus sp.]
MTTERCPSAPLSEVSSCYVTSAGESDAVNWINERGQAEVHGTKMVYDLYLRTTSSDPNRPKHPQIRDLFLNTYVWKPESKVWTFRGRRTDSHQDAAMKHSGNSELMKWDSRRQIWFSLKG